MRILFTFVGGSGHYEPLAPLARAARAAGHSVRFACRPSMVPVVEADHFSAVAAGPDVEDLVAVLPLAELDAANEDRVLRDGFARRTATRRAADLIALGHELRPDLLFSDEVDYGAVIAAERLGLPHVTVLVLVAGSFARSDLLSEPLNEVRSHFGLMPDPDLLMLERHLVLAPFPISFRDPAYPLPKSGYAVRPAVLERREVRSHTELWTGPGTRIYVTLGTIFNMESGDLFTRILGGLAELPAEVIATVGRQRDPADFATQPSNVRIERFIPQADVLPGCDLVVCHGGSGSVIGALSHGVPLLLFPMGADQPHNAARCLALGVGRVLDPVHADPAAIRDATVAMLADLKCRERAQEIRRETLALPDVSTVIARLEALVR